MATKNKETTKKILFDIRGILKRVISKEGVIVTLSILIIAGVVGFVIQDQIQRQRYLELLQLELRSNDYTAGIEVKNVLNKNYLTSHIPLSTAIFNAGLQQGYILTIDTKTQAQLFTLYTGYFPEMNIMMNHDMDMINQYLSKWEECEDNIIVQGITTGNCNTEHQQYLLIQKEYSIYIAQAELQVQKTISTVKFNPTDERLHPKTPREILLRILMGNQSLKVQQ